MRAVHRATHLAAPLEPRRLLAVAWNVTFDDPGNAYAAGWRTG